MAFDETVSRYLTDDHVRLADLLVMPAVRRAVLRAGCDPVLLGIAA
jgi:hypothetical protein